MQAQIPIANLSQPFQLVLVAKVGPGHSGDIAVDDFDWKKGDINCNSSMYDYSSENIFRSISQGNSSDGDGKVISDDQSSVDIDNSTITSISNNSGGSSKYNTSFQGSNDETSEQVTPSSVDLLPSDTNTNSNESTWQRKGTANIHVHREREQVTANCTDITCPPSQGKCC